jgi:hypothetical protein
MALNKKLLAIIGRINPAALDAIFPHGPVGPAGKAARMAAFAQTALSAEDIGAAMASHFASTQWTARRLGIAFDGDPDWWCPTGKPFKLPPGVVFPPVPDPEPYPWLPAFYLGFASRMAVIAEAAADKADREVFDRAVAHGSTQLERSLG